MNDAPSFFIMPYNNHLTFFTLRYFENFEAII